MDRLLEYCTHHPYLAALAALAAAAALGYELWLRAQNAGALAPQDVIRLMNQGATVLDLRAAEAYAAGHITGARNFDPLQIAAASESLKKYKERPLILYCDRGTTTAAAVRTLVQQGFTKVFNLRGGLTAWRAENLPLARG
ncbi:MAG TPA: rhodanese-like domain-containing protein [Steroidobacteraceae bacterium]|jgi:rhodanese-related sulfurtransferase